MNFGLWILNDHAKQIEIKAAIDLAWDKKGTPIIDWLGLEEILVATMKSTEIPPGAKVELAKDAIDAFTKRGHFI